MKIIRRKTKIIDVAGVKIGGKAPIAIQSMTKTPTSDVAKTVKQIKSLKAAGCHIVRVAVPDMASAEAIKSIKKKVDIPLVADIHFNYKLALKAIDCGIDKIRLNPGNIYKKQEVEKVVKLATKHKIPIRVGVNSGSVKKARNSSMVDCMVSSALKYIKLLESFGFYDIVVSLKASSILETIEAYRKMSKKCNYPMHLGVTATGMYSSAIVKSVLGIGSLLVDGIGDTIRVSLTGKPEDEVALAQEILQALGLGSFGPEIISCPTCGRCNVDLVNIVKNFTQYVKNNQNGTRLKSSRVAIMGCFVNGPGEAKEADAGVAFGRNSGLVFRKGNPIKKMSQKQAFNFLFNELRTKKKQG